MIIKENRLNRIMAVVFLFFSLVPGFGFGGSEIDTIVKIEGIEHTAVTAQTEIHYDKRLLEYYPGLNDRQAGLHKTGVIPDDERLLEHYHELIVGQIWLDISGAVPDEAIPPATVIEIIKEVPVIVEIIKEVTVIVEVEKKLAYEFREFEDLAELTDWLEKNRLPTVIVADSSGSANLLNPESSGSYDCDDYAEDLQRKALKQGLLMSQQLVLNGRVYGVRVSSITEPHMGNLAIAGNDIYYIESLPPHDVVKIVSRD
ncbi:MAG: hypothetical protein V3S02_02890 [Dehalococcoidales bacterium]